MREDIFPAADMAPEDNDLPAGDVRTLSVEAEHRGLRLDKYLSEALEMTRSAAVRIMESGCVTVCTPTVPIPTPLTDKNTRLRGGEVLTVILPEATDYPVVAEDIPLDIVYEDEDIIVVNKPVGMVVHPAPGNESGTLVNALLHHCGDSLSGVGGVKRPGIVHRIDKDTSGLLVVAKNDMAHVSLSEQLKTHAVSRVYHAICVGNLREDSGRVDLPLGRNPQDRKKMAAFPRGSVGEGIREAVTHYHVMERFPIGARWGQAFTYIRCELETGRTHQIRVHMAAGGHPLLGDPLYGGDGTRFGRTVSGHLVGQALHAACLRLTHPRTGENMTFTCDLPEDFRWVLEKLRTETAHG